MGEWSLITYTNKNEENNPNQLETCCVSPEDTGIKKLFSQFKSVHSLFIFLAASIKELSFSTPLDYVLGHWLVQVYVPAQAHLFG